MNGKNDIPTSASLRHTSFGSLTRKSDGTIDLYQNAKRHVFVIDILELRAYLEAKTGMEFHYEHAKGCNYFYNFWLEKPKSKLT